MSELITAPARWDLTSIESVDVEALAPGVEARCRRFADRYRGRIASLQGEELGEALAELARIRSLLVWLTGTARLRVALNVEGDAERAAGARADAIAAGAEELLRFFELEWLALPDSRVEALSASPSLGRAAHLLRSLRRFAPHVLPEGEERALAAREPSACEAWLALYEEAVWTVEVELDGRSVAVYEALSYLRDPLRETRRAALQALDRALAACADVVARSYDAVVTDRLAVDELRGYGSPRTERDLENELPAEVVDTMLETLEEHVGLVARWYEHKARLLGIERLSIFDEHAPLAAPEEVTFGDAQSVIESAFTRLAPELGDIAGAFFAEGRIDADPRPGKSGNAFCVPLGPNRPSYVLVNYTEKTDDVLRLAHELGHGVHYALAGATQDSLTFEGTPPIAEIAATFTELLVADDLVAREQDPAARRALRAAILESSLRAVFHAAAFTRFEETAYGTRAAGEPLTADRLAELWLAAHRAYYGEALDLPDEYGLAWMAIPHFVEERFYIYSYVFSHLIALALHARLRASPAETGARFVEFLRDGSSRSPLDQLASLGLDPTRRETWQLGFAELERLVEAASA
jgi:oligoendopeptidase F